MILIIAQTAYQFAAEEEIFLPKGSTLDDIDKIFPGFTARGFSQNGDILNVYFDRNIITIEYKLNGGTTSSKQLIFQGIFEAALEFPANPVKDNADFVGWYKGAERMPPAFPLIPHIPPTVPITAGTYCLVKTLTVFPHIPHAGLGRNCKIMCSIISDFRKVF